MNQTLLKRSESYRKILKSRTVDYLKENEVYICQKCFGSGLGGISKIKGGNDFGWDTNTYCKECSGSGYIGINDSILKIDDTTWYCKECLGDGCHKCRWTGKVDWISRIAGGKS